MKRSIIFLTLGFLAFALVSQASNMTYLKMTTYDDRMNKATAAFEKLFMEDMLEFAGDGRKIFIESWKICQKHQRYPSSGAMSYASFTSARDGLLKVTESFDTLVYDQLVKFKTPAAKALYREALRGIRVAISSL